MALVRKNVRTLHLGYEEQAEILEMMQNRSCGKQREFLHAAALSICDQMEITDKWIIPESVKCASKLSGRTNYSLISWVHPVLGDQEPIGMPHITTEYLRPLQDYPADTRLKVHLTDLPRRPPALCMELCQ